MSDAKPPAEGVQVLAGWGDEHRVAKRDDLGWLCLAPGGHWFGEFGDPDGWITLAHAKAAGRLAEALKGLLQWANLSCKGAMTDEDTDDHTKCLPENPCEACIMQAKVDAVLSEIGT